MVMTIMMIGDNCNGRMGVTHGRTDRWKIFENSYRSTVAWGWSNTPNELITILIEGKFKQKTLLHLNTMYPFFFSIKQLITMG